jgi:hypothetical protein
MSASIRTAVRGPLDTDDNGRGSRRRRSLGLLGALATGALIGATMVTPAHATLGAVGAANAASFGFPSYYQDASATPVKVNLCIDHPLCVGGELPNAGPASLADGNLPDEAFYAYANAEVTLNGGGRLRWRAVLEGAWLAGEVAAGDQMTFTRIQFTGSKINTRTYPAGTVLTATTPYGNISATVAGSGTSGTLTRNRKESAPGIDANGFNRPAIETGTGYGPSFLKWDANAPAGFLGDPNVDHTVTGAKPGNANAVRVFRDGTAVSPLVTTFSVAGRIVR